MGQRLAIHIIRYVDDGKYQGLCSICREKFPSGNFLYCPICGVKFDKTIDVDEEEMKKNKDQDFHWIEKRNHKNTCYTLEATSIENGEIDILARHITSFKKPNEALEQARYIRKRWLRLKRKVKIKVVPPRNRPLPLP